MSTYPTTPPPGYPPPHGQGQLVIVIREPMGSWGMISPLITIDGYPAPARWGANPFPVTPGRHLVRVWNRYLFEYGAAEQAVDVAPGQTVEVHYSPPMVTFVRGRIGFTPQGRPGVAVLVGFLIFVLLVVVGLFAAVTLLD